MSTAQAAAWNAGKAKVLEYSLAIVGDGPYYQNGGNFSADPEGGGGIAGTLAGAGHSKGGPTDPRSVIAAVEEARKVHKYIKIGGSDQHWSTDPNDPEGLAHGSCLGDCHARFLLAWQPGCMMGSNSWDPIYSRPIGEPRGPAVFSAPDQTLTREFVHVKVVFRYSDVATGRGEGVICWGGVCPPSPPPGPPPPPPPPPAPPAPPIGQCPSSVLPDTSFGGNDVSAQVVPSAAACCALCAANKAKGCAEWALHTQAKGKYPANTCHLHGSGSSQKRQVGTVAGVLNTTMVLKSDDRPAGWKCSCANQSLCQPLSHTPRVRDKEVFAYYEDAYGDAGVERMLRNGDVTTIAACGGDDRMLDKHLCMAHAAGVRVVLGCEGCDVWGNTEKCVGHTQNVSYNFNNATARDAFVDYLVTTNHDYGYDGISLE